LGVKARNDDLAARSCDAVIEDILATLREHRIARVPGYAPFRYRGTAGASIRVERQNGNEARIPFSILARAIEAVRADPTVYLGGPARLREFGITHINSPTFALIRVLPLNKIIE
jgi:hypothetical protein